MDKALLDILNEEVLEFGAKFLNSDRYDREFAEDKDYHIIKQKFNAAPAKHKPNSEMFQKLGEGINKKKEVKDFWFYSPLVSSMRHGSENDIGYVYPNRTPPVESFIKYIENLNIKNGEEKAIRLIAIGPKPPNKNLDRDKLNKFYRVDRDGVYNSEEDKDKEFYFIHAEPCFAKKENGKYNVRLPGIAEANFQFNMFEINPIKNFTFEFCENSKVHVEASLAECIGQTNLILTKGSLDQKYYSRKFAINNDIKEDKRKDYNKLETGENGKSFSYNTNILKESLKEYASWAATEVNRIYIYQKPTEANKYYITDGLNIYEDGKENFILIDGKKITNFKKIQTTKTTSEYKIELQKRDPSFAIEEYNSPSKYTRKDDLQYESIGKVTQNIPNKGLNTDDLNKIGSYQKRLVKKKTSVRCDEVIDKVAKDLGFIDKNKIIKFLDIMNELNREHKIFSDPKGARGEDAGFTKWKVEFQNKLPSDNSLTIGDAGRISVMIQKICKTNGFGTEIGRTYKTGKEEGMRSYRFAELYQRSKSDSELYI